MNCNQDHKSYKQSYGSTKERYRSFQRSDNNQKYNQS